MMLSSKQCDLSFLKREFETLRFELFTSDDSISYLSCFACWCKTVEDLTSNWRAIQNLISAYYQPPNEVARWNIYLVFFCADPIPAWEKYVIQNDKYSARKVVLDYLDELPDSNKAQSLLSIQLLGADLKLNDKRNEVEQDATFAMEKYFSGAPLDAGTQAKAKRAEIISNIIEFLSDHENKKG